MQTGKNHPGAAAPKLLEGIVVLDFSRFIAGPYCASILCDLGAEVIRVETIEGGEDRLLAPVTKRGEGAIFLQLNRNKKSIALDFRAENSREVIASLVRMADVVVTNMPPSTLKRSGLDYDSLRAIRPDVIAANVSGFGTAGPLRDLPGFDAVGQAMSGAAYLAGFPGRPSRAGCSYVDFGTGLAAATGILAAIVHRQNTGEGQRVDASLLATAMTFINAAHIEAAATGADREPVDNRSPNSAPSDFIPTSDGIAVVQVVGNAMFARLAAAIGRPDLLDDPDFSSDASRGDNGARLSDIVAGWAAERTTREVMDVLAANGIPVGPVRSPKQAIDDPDTWASTALKPVSHPDVDTPLPIASLLVELDALPRPVGMRFSEVGGDTKEILRTAGYDDGRIAELIASKTVGGPG